MARWVWTVMGFILLGAFLWPPGCTWTRNYGKLNPAWRGSHKMQIEALVENWRDYDVYYAGPSIGSASAVIFDLKGDKRSLQLKNWYPVHDQEVLQDLVRWLSANIMFEPTLYELTGPNGEFFGYVFTPWSHVFTKLIAPDTLWVEDIPISPADYGGGGVLGGAF